MLLFFHLKWCILVNVVGNWRNSQRESNNLWQTFITNTNCIATQIHKWLQNLPHRGSHLQKQTRKFNKICNFYSRREGGTIIFKVKLSEINILTPWTESEQWGRSARRWRLPPGSCWIVQRRTLAQSENDCPAWKAGCSSWGQAAARGWFQGCSPPGSSYFAWLMSSGPALTLPEIRVSKCKQMIYRCSQCRPRKKLYDCMWLYLTSRWS